MEIDESVFAAAVSENVIVIGMKHFVSVSLTVMIAAFLLLVSQLTHSNQKPRPKGPQER